MTSTKQILIALCAIVAIASCKQGGYKKLKTGVEYNLFKKGKGELLKDSDFVKMHFMQKVGDSVYGSSFADPRGPVLQQIQSSPGFLNLKDIFLKMHVGDSVVLRLNKDSVFTGGVPPYVKKTDEVLMILKIQEKLSKAETDSMKTVIAMQNQMQQQQQQQEQEAAQKLVPIETAKIDAYCKSNNIQAQKTQNGVYYAITQAGTGPNCAPGQTISMNYTGTLLNGTKFDSNVDPKFGHQSVFEFPLGGGRVIRGWDEGIPQFNKGSKGILIIPSYLAYGANPREGGPIPPNAILRFDVEVLGMK